MGGERDGNAIVDLMGHETIAKQVRWGDKHWTILDDAEYFTNINN